MWTAFRKNLPRTFLTRKETETLAKQVHLFEEKTGCELVFHFRRNLGEDPLEKNRQLFFKYKLNETHSRRGILITLAVVERKFAVWVDEGIAIHTGEKFWQKIGDGLGQDLKNGHHLQALLNAIRCAEILLKDIPRAEASEGQKNELSDAPIIEEDEK